MSGIEITGVLLTIFTGYWNAFIIFLPKLLGALILLLIGTILGTIARSFLKNIITRYKLDKRLFIEKPVFRLSGIIPTIVAWFIYLIFIKAAIDVFGIPALSLAASEILGLLPQILEAVIVLVFGYVIAEFLKHQIERTDLAYAKIMATVSFFLVIYIAFVIAMPIVGLETDLLENLLLILAGTLGLGIALAIGLGLKDVVTEEAKKYRKKK